VGNIIHTTRIDLSKVDFAWMLGRTVDAYSFYEPCLWTMTLSGGGSMSTEAIWRVSSVTDLIASSTDHGHQFGLLSPVDAAARAREATSSSAIVGVEVRAAAPDLVMRFANGAVLYTADADGQHPLRLTGTPSLNPAWAPRPFQPQHRIRSRPGGTS
jgi:hypothetical protein